MYTVNFGKYIFTEHELPRKQGFVHIITKVDLHVITEIQVFSYTGDAKPVESKTIIHERSKFPENVRMFMKHHHILATHQHLLYTKEIPYLVQVLRSSMGQLEVFLNLRISKLLRHA